MIRFASGLFVLVLVAGCATTPAEAPKSEPRITYQAKKADVRTLVDQIARRGNLNIILDSDVTGTASVSMQEVDPREALVAVAKTFNLQVTEERPGLFRVSAR